MSVLSASDRTDGQSNGSTGCAAGGSWEVAEGTSVDVEGTSVMASVGGMSEEEVEDCGASVTSSAATLTSEDGVDAPEVSGDVPSAAVMAVDEVDGPGVAEVGPKYFNNAPEKIIHLFFIYMF